MAATLSNNELKRVIIETAQKDNPKTMKELAQLVNQRFPVLTEKQITNAMLELESEGKLSFVKASLSAPASLRAFFVSQKALWYWITVALSVVATLTVFAIPENDYPLVYIRSVISFVFVMFLPGYALVKVLFPVDVPLKTSAEMGVLLRFVLSFCMNLALTSTLGLLLSYTPFGLTTTSTTLSLLGLTIVLGTVGMMREYSARFCVK